MTAAAIHSPNKNYHVTSHIKDASNGDTWTAIVPQDGRNLLIIQNKGNGRVGLGFGTQDNDRFFELKGNTTWEFQPGNVPVNYIYFKNLDETTNPLMKVIVASNVAEVEGYV